MAVKVGIPKIHSNLRGLCDMMRPPGPISSAYLIFDDKNLADV
jgi:hypothetical protein